ncbi:MAG TPA: hypothetical protein PLV42_04760 [bacterium]|nr:hypothetical protein [bacterium]
MKGNWKALVYLVLAFEIPFLTLLGYFVGKQIDAALGIADANVTAGIGIIAGLYLCWVTLGKLREFVDHDQNTEE